VTTYQDFSGLASVQVPYPIRGYRWWATAKDGWLESPWYGRDRWDPDRNEARCLIIGHPSGWLRRRKVTPHPNGSPERGCDCGFYGLNEVPFTNADMVNTFPWQTNPLERHNNPALVFGIAEAFGRIFLGEHGWRAQRVRPLAVFLAPDRTLPHTNARAIAERYPRLAMFATLEGLIAEFDPEHDRP